MVPPQFTLKIILISRGGGIRKLTWSKQTVSTKTLEQVFTDYNLSKINLIKIDIEGYEGFAIKSAKKLLEDRKIDNILLQLHPHQIKSLGQSPEEIIDFLKNHGYLPSKKYLDVYTHIPENM